MLRVKFKKLHENAVLPAYAKEGDAGLDLTATSIIKDTVEDLWFKVGLAVEIPEGYEGQIRPRSSISKKGLVLCNPPGTIDSGFRGEIQVRFRKIHHPRSNPPYHIDPERLYKEGDKIAQLVIKPVPVITPIWAEELSNTVRGEGGFGHTD